MQVAEKKFSKDKILSKTFRSSRNHFRIVKTKLGKAAGFDGMYPEFLVHSGPRTRSWLAELFTDMMQSNLLPKSFKLTKIVALLKPGKSADLPESYRPIALLSVTLNQVIDRIVSPEQADFRNGRCCTDQVLTLTNFIEEGFQHKLKTGVVFVDLTATYDTVWKKPTIQTLAILYATC
ncbi:hypothetical protein PR048_031000 [Dryococelus australis]|uniref:Reverse transcriptase domain-containing protein n=1 Tax=Dryococelus australis TaxID=614101 RepID=A0ABQ9G423_9NEOP|nr:hypothetical protein PR048_031000 [Dryococelus australis]